MATEPTPEYQKIRRVRDLLEYRTNLVKRPRSGFGPQDCQTSDSIYHADQEIREILRELGVL